MSSILQLVVFWIYTRALQKQVLLVPASGLAQTRTIVRPMCYLTIKENMLFGYNSEKLWAQDNKREYTDLALMKRNEGT
mgnify:CR=1 FL=1